MTTRDLLTNASKALGLEQQVRLVEPHRYQGILERIISVRTSLPKSAAKALWWWESLREPVATIQPTAPLQALRLIVPRGEVVWFVIEEITNAKKQSNFWLYESTVDAICAVLGELPHVEYYVVSKKCDWLICENHHGLLIASGDEMAPRLSSLPRELLNPTSTSRSAELSQ